MSLPSAAPLRQDPLRVVLLRRGVPAVGAQVHLPLRGLEVVERGVDGLLLDAELAPLLDERVPAVPGRVHQHLGLLADDALVCPQEAVVVLHLRLQRLPRLLRGLRARGPAVGVDAEGVADLVDLLAHRGRAARGTVVLEVNNEDRLLHLAPRLGVRHALEDLLEVREGVPAGRPEERALEARLLLLRDHPGDVAEHRLERPPPVEAVLVLQQRPGRLVLEEVVRLQ
mmetsp:Transcript_53509/g.144293  ORF Transcript_53509/g.144293 Transcript_53509/m.144293 type:complete len:227 (+) Transcript_53509:1539-2219(+)